jgi:Tol biopolymer transport system component
MCQSEPSFTPDGAWLVFGHFDWWGTGLHEIWSMKPDGSDKKVVTGAGETDPNVSPDGRRLSFKDSDVGALWVQNMDGSGLVQGSPTVSVAYKHDWAPDGQHLVFSDNSEPGPTDAVNIANARRETPECSTSPTRRRRSSLTSARTRRTGNGSSGAS